MSERTPAGLPEPQAGDALMAFVTFLIFAVAGPPLGFLVLLFGGSLLSGSMRNLAIPDLHTLRALGVFSLFAYLLGGLQAALVGLVAALTQYRHSSERIPLLPVVLASLITGVAYVGLMAMKSHKFAVVDAAAMLGVHVGAGLGGWLIASGLLCLVPRLRRVLHA
ncbi:MAG TPA: hypothetical protein VH393_06860 [Ktedonobacterales bacterium]